MTSAERVSGFQQPVSAPETLAQLLVLVLRGIIKTLVRRIPLVIGLFVLAILVHTFLLAGPNGGYGRELTLLSDVLATQGRYGMEGTGNNTLGATLIWAMLSALAFYTYYRIRDVGFAEYLSGFKRGIAWIRKSIADLAGRILPTLLMGAAIALCIVGLFKNNAIGLLLCAPLIAALGEQLDSLWFAFLALGWSDAQRVARRFTKREKPFDPATACVGTLGAALGFLVGYILPGIRYSGAYAFIGALVLGAVAVALGALRKKGQSPPSALLLAFMLACLLVAVPVYAHDKGVVEEGGWINWLTQPGVLQAVAKALSPATAAALGLPAGASMSALSTALRKLKPEERVKIYKKVTGDKPELLYPESLKVPHGQKPQPPKPGGAMTLLGQRIQSGTGGPAPPATAAKPPAPPPVVTRDRVYDGKAAHKMLVGLGILTAQQVKDLKAGVPSNLDDLLGNRNKSGKPYDHVLHEYKDSKGNVVGKDTRTIRKIKGIVFKKTKDGQIDLNQMAITVEEDETPSTQPVTPKPKPKPKPKPAAKPKPKPKSKAADHAAKKAAQKKAAEDAAKKAAQKKAAEDAAKKAAQKKARAAPKPKVKPPTITSVLQNRIGAALNSTDSAGNCQLTLTMQDFTGMIPSEVRLPLDTGVVRDLKVSFDPKRGVMTIKSPYCLAKVPAGARAYMPDFLQKVADKHLKIEGPANASVRLLAEDGKLTLQVDEAVIGDMKPSRAAAFAQVAGNQALKPLNQMLADRGATVRDIKIESGGVRIFLTRKP